MVVSYSYTQISVCDHNFIQNAFFKKKKKKDPPHYNKSVWTEISNGLPILYTWCSEHLILGYRILLKTYHLPQENNT